MRPGLLGTLLAVLTLGLASTANAEAPPASPAPVPSLSPALASPAPATTVGALESAAHRLLVMGRRLTVETPKGRFVIVTFPQEAPKTVERMLELAEAGFYDGLAVHRALPGFLVQAGDPATRDQAKLDPAGRYLGGSGKGLPPEYDDQTLPQIRGVVGLARGKAPDSGDSQFYVLLKDDRSLDGQFTAWGLVVDGLGVVDGLELGDRITRLRPVPLPSPSPSPTRSKRFGS